MTKQVSSTKRTNSLSAVGWLSTSGNQTVINSKARKAAATSMQPSIRDTTSAPSKTSKR